MVEQRQLITFSEELGICGLLAEDGGVFEAGTGSLSTEDEGVSVAGSENEPAFGFWVGSFRGLIIFDMKLCLLAVCATPD